MRISKIRQKWKIEYQNNVVLEGVRFWAGTPSGVLPLRLSEQSKLCTEHQWTGKLVNRKNGIEGHLWIEEVRGTLLFSVELKLRQNELTQVSDFAATRCFAMTIENMSHMEQCLAGAMEENLWWMTPYFPKILKEIPKRTQNLLIKSRELYTVYLPLPTKEAVTEFSGYDKGVMLGCSTYQEGGSRIGGRFLAIRTGTDPDACMEEIYRDAMPEQFLIRSDREYPERLRYFGFCSWDAFYSDISAVGLEEKLREFREKKIPVHWLLIDDGWMQTKDRKLCSFQEDRRKFPEGLKGFVRKAKEEYGVEKVGVWHSLQGYWHGVEPGSELYSAQKENLVRTAAGYYVPAWEEGKAFAFFNAWHDYLKKQGIDFIKVDNQGGSSEYARNNVPRATAVAAVLRGLEASALVNFGGDILHCMGMGQAEYLGRYVTGVSRSSDDFFPQRLDGFRSHAMQNAYNSYFHGPVYWCDWDMWWTKHKTAVQSAVLRAISGGPVYVSDKVGETDPERLKPLMEADGRLLMCDAPGRPACSQLMGIGEGVPFLIRNTCQGYPVVAAFTLNECTAAARVRIDCAEFLPDDREYITYAVLNRKYFSINRNSKPSITISLVDGAELLTFYPVENDSIRMGNPEKYLPMACSEQKRISIKDLLPAKK